MKKSVLIIVLIVIIAAVAYVKRGVIQETVTQYAFKPNNPTEIVADAISENFSVAAQDLQVPWELTFLPDGDTLVTERPGFVQRLGATNTRIAVPGVRTGGEGGLLGMVLHPKFTDNNYLYLYFTTTKNSTAVGNVVRFVFANDQLTNPKIIIDDIPAATVHDGGRIAFGPDGLLYVTTGDASEESQAQNSQSLAGKILRVTDEGAIPKDNPFGNAVYSYGHRNPQGLAWDRSGNLWSTEHGRSGASTGYDELNKIVKGANYGWPTIQGDATHEGMHTPAAHSGPTTTWAPAGLTIINDTIYFAGLRGQSLYKGTISGDKVVNITANFESQFGRLRAVVKQGDHLLVTTSNRDGRGRAKDGDDKIIRIPLQ